MGFLSFQLGQNSGEGGTTHGTNNLTCWLSASVNPDSRNRAKVNW